jgi:hypothetical protein
VFRAPLINHANPATAGASAGISTMHDELNSKNPGEQISSPVASVTPAI